MSTEPAPFALAADGGTIAAGDGPELLVWRGDGVPAWKQFTDGILVGLAITADEVVAIDADGRLTRWRRTDGDALGVLETGCRPLALKLVAGGTVGILTGEGVVLVAPGASPRLLPVPGAVAFAFGPGGASVGIGTHTGSFTAIELATGAAWGVLQLPAGIGGIDWSALGTWVVGADRMLYRVRGDGSAIEAAITGADNPIDGVSCSIDGLVCAAQTSDRVELYELNGNKPIGEYLLRRRIGGLSFGPAFTLGIGLDDGDGTVVELASGVSLRTEPHPGRARNTWRLENKVDVGAVRGAIARRQAGSEPIARYVPPPAEDTGSSGCLGGCLAVFGLVVVLSMFCAGVVLLTWVLKTYDLWQFLPLR